LAFTFSQNSSGHAGATLIRVQPESSSCRANATMTPTIELRLLELLQQLIDDLVFLGFYGMIFLSASR
jgi:hypothetical protein